MTVVFAVLSNNIEGQTQLHSIWRSYDEALEAAQKLMTSEFIFAVGPECWKPYTSHKNWWYYGCDSIGIEQYELQGHKGRTE